MKLYIENLTINNIIENDKLYINNNCYNKIYSKEGIFTIENNNIYRLDFIEDNNPRIYPCLIDNYNIICDLTKITKNKVFQIPNNHKFYEYKEYIIKSSSNSIVSLIILTSNNIIKDHYFITNENDINNHFLKNDIIELISYIN